MKLDFRQRLLTTTLLVGASALATPAFAQTTTAPPECPPGTVPGTSGACQPADTASGAGSQPETTTPVEGQTTVPSTSATGEPTRSAQDIVITGTRIPQPNLTSASPVTVLSSQEVKLQGTSRTEDLVNSLPQSFAAQGSNVSNGASGTATVNLRNLGSNRTLVLVNGRRMQPGSIFTIAPDINNIPTQLIKRVDVLTGGASSVYGADAVGGVVNFIMDNTFTGVRIDAQASAFMHKNDTNDDILEANAARGFRPPSGLSVNGGARDIAAILGAAFDDGRGHAQGYLTYRRQDPVLQSSRDYAFCALTALPEFDPRPPTRPSVDDLGRRFSCSGSATSATGTFLQYNPVTFANIDVFQVGGAGGNQFVPGTTPFNFNPYNYFQRPDERYTLGAFADYEITAGAKPYIEAMFMDDQSVAQIAPSGNFGNTGILNCDNPLLSAQQVARMCAPGRTFTDPTVINPVTGLPSELVVVYTLRRNVEGGGRQDDLQHTAYRVVGGVRGDPLAGISYDAYYQYGRTLRNETYLNDFSVTRLGRALDVIDADPGPGVDPQCRAAVTGVDPNCVPFNIFTAGGVDAAALQYLQVPGFSRGKVDQRIGHFDVTLSGAEYGFKTPWADNGVGVNVGAEYRKERLQFRVDEAFRLGDLAGQGGPTPPVEGQFDVRELFAEAQVPIVEKNFIELLQLSAGYRYSNYKVGDGGFNTDTYKLAAEFAPIRDIRFRGAYNRAVRAPNIIELFFPTSLGLGGIVDPCAGASPSATLAQCQLTGVTAAQFGNITPNPANQYNALFGGNPDLTPEKADTYTAGVILQPRFIPGLALTADYFNIKVKNLIGTQTFASVFENCFGGDAAQCALINRAPGTGSLWLGTQGFVILTNQNFAGTGLSTKGWDFSGSYSRRLFNLGTLNASFIGTLLGESNTIGGVPVGGYAGNIPVPKWRHKARLGFQLPNGIGISGQWRHFSSVDCDFEDPNNLGSCAVNIDPDGSAGPLPPVGPIPLPGNEKLNAANFFDLAITARITQKFNLRMGANNILDSEPPVAGQETVGPPFGNGNTFPQIYDSLGRYIFAGVTVDF